jgi:hypothetical protein
MVLLAAAVAAAALQARAWPWSSGNDATCRYTKQHIQQCADYADANHDGVLTRAEMQAVLDTAPWVLKQFIEHVMGGIGRIIDNCGVPEREVITRESFFARDNCMRTCRDRTLAVEYYCSKQAAAQGTDFDTVVGLARRDVQQQQQSNPPDEEHVAEM